MSIENTNTDSYNQNTSNISDDEPEIIGETEDEKSKDISLDNRHNTVTFDDDRIEQSNEDVITDEETDEDDVSSEDEEEDEEDITDNPDDTEKIFVLYRNGVAGGYLKDQNLADDWVKSRVKKYKDRDYIYAFEYFDNGVKILKRYKWYPVSIFGVEDIYSYSELECLE